jgi:hypothetical protein
MWTGDALARVFLFEFKVSGAIGANAFSKHRRIAVAALFQAYNRQAVNEINDAKLGAGEKINL